jgi:hypothetical protein
MQSEFYIVDLSREAAHCRGGYYFCLDTKGSKKSSQQKCFFAALGLCPANQAKPGLLPFHAASLAHSPRFSKKPLCPAITHKATIVLPDFIRSCSTAGGRKKIKSISH